MQYPSLDEYHALIQHPRSFFVDKDLQAHSVETNRMGLPHGLSGGFAMTYALLSGRSKVAIRCFKQEVPQRERVYKLIDAQLKKIDSPYFVDFEYQPKGLRYKNGFLPCLKMEWVEGDTLSVHLSKRGNDRYAFDKLRAQFSELQIHLEQNGIAHGDIQADNVIVTPTGGLKLIDYDGMFVKGLTVSDASECGLPNYQHPERSLLHFGATMDRFSFALLDLTFAALGEDPSLRARFPAGDQAILFDRTDYIDPGNSKRFRAVEQIASLSLLAQNFKSICLASVLVTPSLKDFRAGRNIPKPTRNPSTPKPKIVQDEIKKISQQTRTAMGSGAQYATKAAATRSVSNQAAARSQPSYFLPAIFAALAFAGLFGITQLLEKGTSRPSDNTSIPKEQSDAKRRSSIGVCERALNRPYFEWSEEREYQADVIEAKARGLSVGDCRVALGLPRSLHLVDRVVRRNWAVGGRQNCNVPSRVYSALVYVQRLEGDTDNSIIRWQDGTGRVFLELITYSQENGFRTETIQSPSHPRGTTWQYTQSAAGQIHVRSAGARGISEFVVVPCN